MTKKDKEIEKFKKDYLIRMAKREIKEWKKLLKKLLTKDDN